MTTAHATAEAATAKERQRALLIGLLVALLGLPPGIVAVVLGNSIALFSDLLRAATDALAMLLSWLTLRAVARSNADAYNYGLGKLESAASVVIAGAMLVSLVVVLFGAAHRLLHPQRLGHVGLGLALTTLAAAGDFVGWKRVARIARKQHSPVMEAQWRLYRNKTAACTVVAVSLAVSMIFAHRPWAAYVDPIGALVIAGFIVVSAYAVSSSSLHDLLDGSLEESMQIAIVRALATHFDAYDDVHGIRSRRSGGHVYIEIFLQFDPAQTMAQVQRSIDAIRAELESRIAGSQVVVAPVSARRG